jgi:hypothetical protein
MRRVALGIAIVLIVAACGGSSKVSSKDLGKLVLQQADVGAPFASFGDGPQITLDNAGTPRADPARYGREGGWIARFHRSATKTTKGPLVIESRVDVFKSDGGAKSDLDDYRTMLVHQPGASPRSLTPPAVGDEAVETTFAQAGALPVRFFRIAWRYRNATASITVQGWGGRVTRADAERLAREQQARLQHR